jgi:hypothetical protein
MAGSDPSFETRSWSREKTCCWVVGLGRKKYEAVLLNPKKMPRDMEFESLLRLTETP